MIMRKYISAVLVSAILLLSIPFTASADTGPTYSDSYPTVGIKYGDDVIITPMQSENSYYITWESDLS